MKKKLLTFCIFAAALNAAAALTVTATNGVESLTLAFDAAADARELWVAWDDADKGAGFADWAESERVAIVAADETKVYTIATATEVTGNFADVNIPKKWRVSVLGSQVKLGYANGTILYFR